MLFIVGTPIGNIDDMSPRAQHVLKSAALIACEDTRVTGLLLSNLKISNKLTCYHEHNRKSKEPYLLRMLEAGEHIALVSDAGMPCISDPGVPLVRQCIDKNIPITVIPGPVAAMAALAVSGLDTERFIFEGFIPSDGLKRKQRLGQIAQSEITTVLYEAPHRLMKTLSDLNALGMGERRVVLCREMTKKYEEIIRCTLNDAKAQFDTKKPKGEFAIVIEGQSVKKEEILIEDREKIILEQLALGLSTKDISVMLSAKWNENRRNVYTEVIKVLESKKK